MKWNAWLKSVLCVVLLGIMVCVTALPAQAVVASSSTIAPAGGTSYLVNCSGLNLRSAASTSSTVIRVLPRGTQVTYLSDSNGWWRVSTSYGIGWVDKKYLAPTSTGASTGTYSVTASKLNVRSYPRLTASRIGTLTKGQTIAISELNGDWGYSPTVKGWVALAYLSRVTGSVGTTSTVSSVSVNGVYTITATALNVRTGAGTNYTSIGLLRKGASVTVSQVSGNWAYVTSGSTRGWIYWRGYVG